MSGSSYKRATKKYAARVDHTDGDTSNGFVLVPVGGDFVTTLTQSAGFLHFEMESGEETYLSLQSIKRITERVDENERRRDEENQARQKADEKAKADAQRAEREQQQTAGENAARKSKSTYSSKEEYDALDILGLKEKTTHEELQGTYRRLVKLYHPDRLRGLGVSDKKIAYAAERLAEINNAYRILSKITKAA